MVDEKLRSGLKFQARHSDGLDMRKIRWNCPFDVSVLQGEMPPAFTDKAILILKGLQVAFPSCFSRIFKYDGHIGVPDR